MVPTICPNMMYIWTIGVNPDCFGDDYGIRLGVNGFKTVVFEMHWNNEQRLSGQTDNSGVRFYYSPHFRQYDAETLFFGPEYLELPPGQSNVMQGSRCESQCISNIFNSTTVYISQITPHMHYAGE